MPGKQVILFPEGVYHQRESKSMVKREHPVLVATRMTPRERKMVGVAAALEGVTVKDLLRNIVLPVVAARVARSGVELQEQG